MDCLEVLSLVGSILSIISFFPIMGAAYLYFRKKSFKTITLKDNQDRPFQVKVRRKFFNNKDLTPLVQDFYDGPNNIDEGVRKQIISLTLESQKNMKHIDPYLKKGDIDVSPREK